MTTTLFVLGSFIFLDATLDQTLDNIRERVDINVYFSEGVPESDVLAVRDQLEDLNFVSSAEYISPREVLQDFETRYENNQDFQEALDEVGENPFGATLNVQATDPSFYSEVNDFLARNDIQQNDSGDQIIERVNFEDNRQVFERLVNIINTVDFVSVAVLIFFAFISVLITFNTVRLAIYNSRDEIAVMKLVGASNTYIRGPFVIEGIMYGIASALIALILFYPLAMWIGDPAASFFGSQNLLEYYVDNFASFFIIITVTGVVLGSISSFLAVKKYLKN
jgi:cell division transport system permease protein